MATQRNLVFMNEGYYHVFNRGIEGRKIFLNIREYKRAMNLLSFYQYADIPIRYSRFSELPENKQLKLLESMEDSGEIIDIVAYCLMPNHFHLLLKQKKEKGVATYMANFMNAYTKYFNTKHERIGPLFQGIFKAVYVETNEQLLHLTRYIHLNPIASSLISASKLQNYPWSSYPAYLKIAKDTLVKPDIISEIRSQIHDYEKFVKDQISYAKELEKIKHIIFE